VKYLVRKVSAAVGCVQGYNDSTKTFQQAIFTIGFIHHPMLSDSVILEKSFSLVLRFSCAQRKFEWSKLSDVLLSFLPIQAG